MKVAVWDTYVRRSDGEEMHFDIVVPETLAEVGKIYEFGKNYLSTKPFEVGNLSSKECRFCHIENASMENIESIEQKGYFIIEIENCN